MMLLDILARSEQLTGHDLEALEHFRLFAKVSATDAKITDAMREKAKQNAAELSAKVAQVDIEVPATARVTVDGKALEESPPKDPVPVQPGKHRVEATFEGKLKSVTVECAAGSIVKAKIIFEPGGTTEPPPEDPRQSRWTTARIVTVSALSAGAIAGGVLFFVFHAKAQSKVDDSKNLLQGASCIGVSSDACRMAATLKDDRDSAVTLSTVSIVAGSVLAAGAIATALIWPRSSKESAHLVPNIAPGIGGASFVGSF